MRLKEAPAVVRRGPAEEATVPPPAGWPPPSLRGRARARRSQASWDQAPLENSQGLRPSARQVPRGERSAPAYGNARGGCSKTCTKLRLRLVFLEANEVMRLLFCALETGK